MQYFYFCDWLTLISMMPFSFIHIIAHFGMHIYTFLTCIFLCTYIHSSINGHLGCFYIATIINNAAINRKVQITLEDSAFNSFGQVPRRRFLDHMVVLHMFSILRNLLTVFHSELTILHSEGTVSWKGTWWLFTIVGES